MNFSLNGSDIEFLKVLQKKVENVLVLLRVQTLGCLARIRTPIPKEPRLTSMLVSDLIVLSLRQLHRNKRRYKGVVIGIGLGLAGLVTVLTMGDSVESDVGSNLELLGCATIVKATWDFDRSQRWHHGSYSQKDIDDLRRISGVAGATLVVWSWETEPIYETNKATDVRLLGVEPAFHWICNAPVSAGRPISVEDVTARKSVCVIGKNVRKKLFNGNVDPLGKRISLSGNQFRVVGIIGGIEDVTMPDTVIVPITVARSVFANMYHIRDVYVRTENWDVVETVRQEILSVLARNQPAYAEAMTVVYYPETLKTIKKDCAHSEIVFICVTWSDSLARGARHYQRYACCRPGKDNGNRAEKGGRRHGHHDNVTVSHGGSGNKSFGGGLRHYVGNRQCGNYGKIL